MRSLRIWLLLIRVNTKHAVICRLLFVISLIIFFKRRNQGYRTSLLVQVFGCEKNVGNNTTMLTTQVVIFLSVHQISLMSIIYCLIKDKEAYDLFRKWSKFAERNLNSFHLRFPCDTK